MTTPRQVVTFVDDDYDFDREMAGFCERVRMALAEGGYPNAHVYSEWSGVFVEGVPDDVKQRAFDVVNGYDARTEIVPAGTRGVSEGLPTRTPAGASIVPNNGASA